MNTLENDFEMSSSFTDELVSSIMEHDNVSVKYLLESKKSTIKLMNDSLFTSTPALSKSVEADNLQATCLLLEYGWEDGTNTALADTILKNEYSKARFLVSLGFQQSCNDCYECGWPNTCALVNTMTSYDEASTKSINDLDFWCRSHEDMDVIHSFSQYLLHHNFDETIASVILDTVIATGNTNSDPCTFPLTEESSDFVISMCDRGLIDITRQAHRITVEMLECIYSISTNPSTKAAFLFNMLKKFIDMGACVDTELEVEETYMLPLVLPSLDLDRDLSVREIVGGFRVEDRDIKRVKRAYSRQPYVKKVAEYMKLSMEYIRFVARSGFIAKRIRGFDDTEEPDHLSRRLIGMPPEIFGRVMMFVA